MMFRTAQVLVLLAAIYLMISGYAKLTDTPTFEAALIRHDLVPASFVPLLGLLFPLVEVIASSLAVWWITSPRRLSRAGLGLAVIFAILGVYSVLMWWRPASEPVPCGCGFTRAPIDNWHLPTGQNLGTALVLLGVGTMVTVKVAPDTVPTAP